MEELLETGMLQGHFKGQKKILSLKFSSLTVKLLRSNFYSSLIVFKPAGKGVSTKLFLNIIAASSRALIPPKAES